MAEEYYAIIEELQMIHQTSAKTFFQSLYKPSFRSYKAFFLLSKLKVLDAMIPEGYLDEDKFLSLMPNA